MQDAGPLESAEEWFVHYWPNKTGHIPAIRRLLATAFARGLSMDEAARHAVQHPIGRSLSAWNRRAYEFVGRWLPCG